MKKFQKGDLVRVTESSKPQIFEVEGYVGPKVECRWFDLCWNLTLFAPEELETVSEEEARRRVLRVPEGCSSWSDDDD